MISSKPNRLARTPRSSEDKGGGGGRAVVVGRRDGSATKRGDAERETRSFEITFRHI